LIDSDFYFKLIKPRGQYRVYWGPHIGVLLDRWSDS